MAEINHPTQLTSSATVKHRTGRLNVAWTRKWWALLLGTLLALELLLPYVIWKARLPRLADFFTELVAGAILVLTVGLMLVRDRIPKGFLFILALSLIWGLVAYFDGQTMAATAWGWTRFFKYPVLALFAYLIPDWPDDFARWFPRFCLAVLGFEIVFQMIQIAMGEPPGDSLAGSFGYHGVGKLTIFTFFLVSLALGEWIVTRRWRLTLLVLSLGALASAMSVTKFYFIGVVFLGAAAIAIYIVRGGRARSLIVFLLGMTLIVSMAVMAFNWYAATTRNVPPLQSYLNLTSLEKYLFSTKKGEETGSYYLQRGVAIAYAWQQLQRDTETLLFGYGLGSRAYSTALGITGKSLEGDLLSINRYVDETGLASFLQEFGLVGLLVLLAFDSWVIYKLVQHSRRTEDQDLAILECGVALFTLFWPLWLWYNKAWTFGFSMALYWIALGYIFQRISADHRQRKRNAFPTMTARRSMTQESS